MLPLPITEEPSIGSIERFEEYLSHNELELAMDELEGLGELNSDPLDFWHELASAAENMGLRDRAAIYRRRSG